MNKAFCDEAKYDPKSPCYHIRQAMQEMRADLGSAKKVLKTQAFYRWAIEKARKDTEAIGSEQEKSAEMILKLRMEGNLGFYILHFMRLKYKDYFDQESENIGIEGRGFKQLEEYFEGARGEYREEFPGEIAKKLNRLLKQQMKAKKGNENSAIEVGRWLGEGAVCDEVYCESVPVGEMSAKDKKELVAGTEVVEIPPEIAWAFKDPEA